MAPAPSAARAQAPEAEAEARARRTPPSCPRCAVASEGAPDAYGVYRCSGCGIEFRPPWRVPVRQAGVSAAATSAGGNGWIGLAVLGGLIVGLAIAVGDSQAPSEPPRLDGLAFDPKLEVPPFEPIAIDGLDIGVGLFVPLTYEVHVSSIERDELVLTGLVRNPSPSLVEGVEVEVRCLDATGGVLAIHTATQACGQLGADEVCAWGLDTRVPAIAGFEVIALGRRALPGMQRLDLRARFDGEGRRLDAGEDALGLDLDARRVHFALAPGVSAFEVDAVVVSYDASGKVWAVERTRWPGMIAGGSEQDRPAGMVVDEDVHEYELRVFASLVVRDVASAPLGETP